MEVEASATSESSAPRSAAASPSPPLAAPMLATGAATAAMSGGGPAGGERLSGVTVCCPVVLGCVAFLLGKDGDELHTHCWTLYVRGAHGEDISYFVSKVVFTLHASFEPPTRELTEWPYEVTEKGWGEFEAKITLHFKDPAERPIDVPHPVKLYADAGMPAPGPGVPVVTERYDEIVFTDPKEGFFACLMEGQTAAVREHPQLQYYKDFSAEEDVQKLAAAREYVHGELEAVKDRILRLDAQIKDTPASSFR
eukprot:TRINITY_DN3500_c0_g1_i1.p1 TRINITY_DN3500_c0_g1~~TRINITY_DN3500_c0_g1_i1.p1  ORF type:complete len:253 (+),score=54.00 TRINITY_DN3500_c0_g1_i1:180-938(+)